MEEIIFHIDVNSAFLSWTAVRLLSEGYETDIRTVPSIIGGDKEKRHGIVLAKSIPAKRYGIETAEPVAAALKKCPDLLVFPPDFHLYSTMSHNLMDYLHGFTDDIEQASVDECYLYYTPIMHKYGEPVAFANKIRAEVYKQYGFTVNVGISDKKVLAKMASDFTKPDKTHTLFSSEIKEKMWPLPVRDLFLCGKSAAARLNTLGIFTIGELAVTDKKILTDNLKSHGITLWEFANGIDDSKVHKEHSEAKGIGNSTTSEHDVTDGVEAEEILYELCESVSHRLKKGGFLTSNITVEIKYTDFRSYSKQCPTDTPIYTTKALHDYAVKLFYELWNREPIRLLGVRATKLSSEDEPVQLSLFDIKNPAVLRQDSEKQIALEAALSDIRKKYGYESVKKGRIT